MSKTTQGKDPFAAAEAVKYESPIASREYILQVLGETGACSFKRLAKLVHIDKDDAYGLEALRRRVGAMLRDMQLIEEANGDVAVIDASQFIAGKVSAHKEGYGFVLSAQSEEDLFLNYHEMRKVFDGDDVLVSVSHVKRNGKKEASIVQVTQHNTHRVVGKLLRTGDKLRVVAENPKLHHTIYIAAENTLQAEHESLVVVEITQQPSARQQAKGIIVKVLGDRTTPGVEVDIALHQFAIPHEWPEAVLSELKGFKAHLSEKDKVNRIDLRDLPLVTIDGEDAKDFDDAVYCEKKAGGGWRLWVAIADVSHYVQERTALNEEAVLRATSVYFPDYVVPMLPEALSNGLCSLKPLEERLAMVCEMTISARGRLSGFEFYEAVIRSHARLTYNEVAGILRGDTDRLDAPIQAVVPALKQLHKLYQALRVQREIRGALDFETVEVKAVFDENRKIEQLITVERNDAHKIIEECMLCANIAAAKFLLEIKVPTLFRVHEGPTEKKLKSLREYLAELGLSLSGGDKPEPRHYQELTAQIQGREDSILIQTMLLRSMSQAVYQPENKGHFGLAYESYAHFTSPIRRYPDLLVHRAIRYAMYNIPGLKHIKLAEALQRARKKQKYAYDMPRMVQLGEHCSMAERRAEDASRDVLSALKCEYLQKYIGEQFTGVISSVANFGLFIELQELHIEGMVHVSELGDDFFHFDGKQRLVGERTRAVYRLGDKLTVCVARVELEDRKIHLQLVHEKQKVKKEKTQTKARTPRRR